MLLVRNAIAFFLVLLNVGTARGSQGPLRLSVLEFSVIGYAPLKDVRSYLDVGLKPSETSEDACDILKPHSKTAASRQPWAPFDFYTNVLNPEEQAKEKAAGSLGEADIFFPGDNFNRNDSDKSHEWTRKVATNFRGSLDFLEPQISETSFSFSLKFTRGLLSYGGFIRVTPRLTKGQCSAAVYFCTKPLKQANGKTACAPSGWTKKIHRIVAEASVSGAMSDKFNGVVEEKKKNDIASLSIEFQDVDSSGDEIGSRYLEKVAAK